jgi:hypothetical protein
MNCRQFEDVIASRRHQRRAMKEDRSQSILLRSQFVEEPNLEPGASRETGP